MAVYQRRTAKGTVTWNTSFQGPTLDGETRRYRYALGAKVRNKREAEDAERRLRVQLEDEIKSSRSSPVYVDAGSVGALAHRWYGHNVAVGAWKPSTARLYRTILDGWILPELKDVPLPSLTAIRIDAFKEAVALKERGPKWNHTVLGALAAMCSKGLLWRLLTANPCDQVEQFKVPDAAYDWYTDAETERWMASCRALYPELSALFLTLFRAGLRLGEAFALRWDDVDLANSHLHVRQSITRGRVGNTSTLATTTPKNGKARIVDMAADLVDEIRGHRHPGERVFVHRKGESFTRETLLFQWKRITRHAGLRLLTPHDARHSFASQLVSAGAPLAYVQIQLGHSTIRMTERYAHLAPQGDRWVRLLSAKKGTQNEPV